MTEVDLFRNSHLLDPHMHIWGWEIPVYLFLGGMTAGVMILSALIARGQAPADRSKWARLLPFAAPLLISIGMGALFLDLEHKLFVHRFYLALNPTSPMSWGAWVLLGIYPASLLLGLASLLPEEVKAFSGWRAVKALRLGGVIERVAAWGRERSGKLVWWNVGLGVALGAYTGVLLGSIGARAVWSSMVLAPLFLVSGVSTGAALMMLFPINHEEHALVRRWDMGAIGVELVLLGLFFAGLYSAGSGESLAAVQLFFGGPFTAVFWAVVVVAGLVVPFLLEAVEGTRKLQPTIMAASLILVGGLALRWVLVVAGQTM